MTLDWLFRTSPANSVRGARLVGSGVGPIGARLMLEGLAAALGVVANARAGDATVGPAPFSSARPGPAPAGWQFVTLPNKPDKTSYSIVDLEGKSVLKVASEHAYGNLAHVLDAPLVRGTRLEWQWRVDKLNEKADITVKSGEDSSAKLCLSFALPSDKLSFGERTKLSLARMALGTDVPTETLCYLWDDKLPKGTEMVSVFTKRIRQIVLRSRGDPLGQWQTERRDVAADYQRLFGKESGGELPPISELIVSADSDNTGDSSLAYFGDIKLTEPP